MVNEQQPMKFFEFNRAVLDELVLEYLDHLREAKCTRVVGGIHSCQQLRSSLASGDVGAAMLLLKECCPALMEDQHLVFKLCKQKFVEQTRLRTPEGDARAAAIARDELVPLALNAYPEAYSEFQHLHMLLVYPNGGPLAAAAAAASLAAREDLAATVYHTARQALGLFEPKLLLLLRYLLHVHVAYQARSKAGFAAPQAEDVAALLRQERDAPPLPCEYVPACSIQEADVQLLIQCVGSGRGAANHALKAARGDLKVAFKNELSRLRLNDDAVLGIVGEYAAYQNLLEAADELSEAIAHDSTAAATCTTSMDVDMHTTADEDGRPSRDVEQAGVAGGRQDGAAESAEDEVPDTWEQADDAWFERTRTATVSTSGDTGHGPGGTAAVAAAVAAGHGSGLGARLRASAQAGRVGEAVASTSLFERGKQVEASLGGRQPSNHADLSTVPETGEGSDGSGGGTPVRSRSRSPPTKLRCVRRDCNGGADAAGDSLANSSVPPTPFQVDGDPKKRRLLDACWAGGGLERAVHNLMQLAKDHCVEDIVREVRGLDSTLFDEEPALLFELHCCRIRDFVGRGDFDGALWLVQSTLTPLASGSSAAVAAELQPKLRIVSALIGGSSTAIERLPKLADVVERLQAALLPRLGLQGPRLVRLLQMLLEVHRAWMRRENMRADPFLAELRIDALSRPSGAPESHLDKGAPAATGAAPAGQATRRCSDGVDDLVAGTEDRGVESDDGDGEEEGDGQVATLHDVDVLVERLIEILELPRSAAISLLHDSDFDVEGAVIRYLS